MYVYIHIHIHIYIYIYIYTDSKRLNGIVYNVTKAFQINADLSIHQRILKY